MPKTKHHPPPEAAEELEDIESETAAEEEEPSKPSEKSAEMMGERPGRTIAFARRHPALTVIGAAGVGLLGGIEVAAGVLLGAGVLALIRGRRAPTPSPEEVRERARSMMERVPPLVRKRARAILQAARGRLEPAAT